MRNRPPHDIAWGWLLFGLALLLVTWPWRLLRRATLKRGSKDR